MPNRIRAPRVAAIFAAVGPLAFLVCEAVSALAWTAGTYSYGVNFVSDLGTTTCGAEISGRVLCSPLHGVMNAGYATMGVTVALAVALISRALPRGRRITTTTLGAGLAVGMILVAAFHGEPAAVQDGTIVLHALGAVIAILAGNVLGIVMGTNRRHLGLPRWFGPLATALGVLGILSLVGCLALDSAVFERMAVYPVFAWLVVTSALLLRRSVETRSSQTPRS